MIPVTYEPMEGVAVDVQDHARRTGTSTDMTEGFSPKRRRTSCRGTLTELDLGGLCPFQ
jgi:hypothetical protein